MRRMPAFAAATVLVLAGCSSGLDKPTAAPAAHASTSVASTATSAPDHTVEALECGMFDIGAVYLNDEWPAIIGGHPRLGYALNLEKAADTWQQGLNSYSSGTGLDQEISRAASGVHDMESAMAASNGSAPVEIGDQVAQIRDAFTVVSGDCADIGYHMTQPLKG